MLHYEQYITYNNVERSDEVIFTKNSFEENDGYVVPIATFGDVTMDTIVGMAKLENRDEGVYAYCTFYDMDLAKEVVRMLNDKKLTMSFRAYDIQYKSDKSNEIRSGLIRVLIPTPTGLCHTYQVKMEV